MINVSDHQAARDGPDEPASSLFQTQWQTYRKIVENNYTFHREAYSELHRISKARRPAQASHHSLSSAARRQQ
jgi:hypothetical protein